ncbi:SCO3242 family prenyltransferase [Streptomyces sp. NPDC050704]|uniref:SCO3242 family prenyltransferase n=1 Tax=Streptomyces sp. NPDC050704 TaxID=3157219 RepID=UPI003438468E
MIPHKIYRRPRLRDLAELVRAPAALSVPGDVLAGAVASGRPLGPRTLGTMGSSVCLYWAGMALNDYADATLDAVERPGRPIPSGRIPRRTAFTTATALTAAGLGLAALSGGRRALRTAVPLAGLVWAYDLVLKNTPAGPAAMAGTRVLDVLAGARTTAPALPAALVVGLHTYTVTALSRHETTGAPTAVPAASLAASTVVGLSAAATARTAGRTSRLGAAAGAAGYLVAFGSAQVRALGEPSAPNIQRAVGVGILGLLPLQAALTAGAGAPRAAALLAAAHPLARRLARKVSPT